MAQSLPFASFFSPYTSQQQLFNLQSLSQQQQQQLLQQQQQQQKNQVITKGVTKQNNTGYVLSQNVKQAIPQSANPLKSFPLTTNNSNNAKMISSGNTNSNTTALPTSNNYLNLAYSSSIPLLQQSLDLIQPPNNQHSFPLQKQNILKDFNKDQNVISKSKDLSQQNIEQPEQYERANQRRASNNVLSISNSQNIKNETIRSSSINTLKIQDVGIKVVAEKKGVSISCKRLLSQANSLIDTLKIGQFPTHQAQSLVDQIQDLEGQFASLRLQIKAQLQDQQSSLQVNIQPSTQVSKIMSLRTADMALKGLQQFRRDEKNFLLLDSQNNHGCSLQDSLNHDSSPFWSPLDIKGNILKNLNNKASEDITQHESIPRQRNNSKQMKDKSDHKKKEEGGASLPEDQNSKNQKSLVKPLTSKDKNRENHNQEKKGIMVSGPTQIKQAVEQQQTQNTPIEQPKQNKSFNTKKKVESKQTNKVNETKSQNATATQVQESSNTPPPVKSSTQVLMAKVNHVLQKNDRFLLNQEEQKNPSQIEKQSTGKKEESSFTSNHLNSKNTKVQESNITKQEVNDLPYKQTVPPVTSFTSPLKILEKQDSNGQTNDINDQIEPFKRKDEFKIESYDLNLLQKAKPEQEDTKKSAKEQKTDTEQTLDYSKSSFQQPANLTATTNSQQFNSYTASNSFKPVEQTPPLNYNSIPSYQPLTQTSEYSSLQFTGYSGNSIIPSYSLPQASPSIQPPSTSYAVPIPKASNVSSYPSIDNQNPLYGYTQTTQQYGDAQKLNTNSSEKQYTLPINVNVSKDNYSSIQPSGHQDLSQSLKSDFSLQNQSNKNDKKEQAESIPYIEAIKQINQTSTPTVPTYQTPVQPQSEIIYSSRLYSDLPKAPEIQNPYGISNNAHIDGIKFINNFTSTLPPYEPANFQATNYNSISQSSNQIETPREAIQTIKQEQQSPSLNTYNHTYSDPFKPSQDNNDFVDDNNQFEDNSYQQVPVAKENSLKNNLVNLARNIGSSGVHSSATLNQVYPFSQQGATFSQGFKGPKEVESDKNSEGSNDGFEEEEQPTEIAIKARKFLRNYRSSRTTYLPLYDEKNPFEYSLENFTVGKKLGHGKFADVFAAYVNETGFRVALKQIKKSVIKEFNLYQDILSEIKIQSSLSHPNIIKLYGFFIDEESVYLIQELACGKELFVEQKSSLYKKFTENQTAFYIKQVIEALLYMHSKQVVHRDIKPENIMVYNPFLLFAKKNILKICDFGYAVTVENNRMRKTFCGTLDYVSPEMVQGQEYNYSVDVWSVGILTYELVIGKSPFQGKDSEETFGQIVNGDLSFSGPISFNCGDFISRILERDPKQRLSLTECLQHPFIQDEYARRLNNDEGGVIDFSDLQKL